MDTPTSNWNSLSYQYGLCACTSASPCLSALDVFSRDVCCCGLQAYVVGATVTYSHQGSRPKHAKLRRGSDFAHVLRGNGSVSPVCVESVVIRNNA